MRVVMVLMTLHMIRNPRNDSERHFLKKAERLHASSSQDIYIH